MNDRPVHLRNPGWRAGWFALVVLGVVVAVGAAGRLRDDGSLLIDGFFLLLSIGLAVVGLLVAMSSVVLSPGEIDVVNGIRHHKFHVVEVTAVSIAGYGDQRGGEPGLPPPRSTWCMRLDSGRGHVLSVALAANRRASQRARLEELVAEVTRHCGLGEGPT